MDWREVLEPLHYFDSGRMTQREKNEMREQILAVYQDVVAPFIVTLAPRALRERHGSREHEREYEPSRSILEYKREVELCDEEHPCSVVITNPSRRRRWLTNRQEFPSVSINGYMLPIYVLVYIIARRDGWPLPSKTFVFLSRTCSKDCVDISHMVVFQRQ